MSTKRFIKFIPSDKSQMLMKRSPTAFCLLSIIASRARRESGQIDGLEIGECFIGDCEEYGMTRQQYRTALKVLCEYGIVEIIETCRSRTSSKKYYATTESTTDQPPKSKKSTTEKTMTSTTVSTKVKLLQSDIWDTNPNGPNHRKNDDINHREKQEVEKINHRINHKQEPKKEERSIQQVNDSNEHAKKSRASLTSCTNNKLSLVKWHANMTDDQMSAFEWLKTLEIDTSEDTLSWWARNYTIDRLRAVYEETQEYRPESKGAYIHRLLKSKTVVTYGRIKMNAEYAEEFKQLKFWHDLEIFKKYCVVRLPTGGTMEVDFNFEPEIFRKFLHGKYTSYKSIKGD